MAKIHLTYQQILEHLDMIDSHLHMPYKEFEIPSFIYTSSGKNNIRDVALGMMLHVGLVGYEPIIKYENLGQHTGGHICLNNNLDRKVYITLSNDTEISKESELATLAHEICHKLLYTHNCYFPSMGDYNESLTDIATIYAGFGKLTINGCERTTTKTNHFLNQTTTTTRYTGYLDATQYLIAYKIVCQMNNISTHDVEYGIDKSKLDILHTNATIQHIKFKRTEFPEVLKKYRVRRYQKDASLMRDIILLENELSELKSQLLLHQKSDIAHWGKIDNNDGSITSPYGLLLATTKKIEVDETQKEISTSLNRFGAKHHKFSEKVQGMTLTIVCPNCGYTKANAFKEYKKTLIRCPKCGNVFYWDATRRGTWFKSLVNRIKSLLKKS